MRGEDDWSLWYRFRELQAVCRQAAHLDLAGRGCYPLPASLLGDACPALGKSTGAAGVTWLDLDEDCRPWLVGQGEWRGRGFACLSFGDLPVAVEKGTALHELAHWLALMPPYLDGPARSPAKMAACMARIDDALRLGTAAAKHIIGHDADFMRAGLHLHSRAAAGGGISFLAMNLDGNRILSAAETYRSALHVELVSRAGESIRAILASPPPVEFAAIWAADVKRITGRELEPET